MYRINYYDDDYHDPFDDDLMHSDYYDDDYYGYYDAYSPYDDELQHFGVKGMKWGVRKARPSSGGGKRNWKKIAKRAAIGAGVAAGAAALGYGAYRLHKAGARPDVFDMHQNKDGSYSTRGGDINERRRARAQARAQAKAARAEARAARAEARTARWRKRRYGNKLSHSGYYDGDELQHFGVKGMKWGVRKARPESNNPNRGRVNRAVAGSILKNAAKGGLGYTGRYLVRGTALGTLGGLGGAALGYARGRRTGDYSSMGRYMQAGTNLGVAAGALSAAHATANRMRRNYANDYRRINQKYGGNNYTRQYVENYERAYDPYTGKRRRRGR